jgi:hypothetical protein
MAHGILPEISAAFTLLPLAEGQSGLFKFVHHVS